MPLLDHGFRFESTFHPRLVQLRKQEGLDQVVSGAKSELEQFVLLRDWTKRQWKHSHPKPYPPWDALTILDRIRSGKTGGFCAQYAVVFLQACLSFGYQGRYLDINKTGGTGHFVVEVWSNQFGKWIIMDPDYNIHFEKDGVPLGALELHRAWVEGRWKDISVIEGPGGSEAPSIHATQYNLIDYYQHFSVDLRNDHLSKPFPFWNRKTGYLSWRDQFTDGRPDAHRRFTGSSEDLYWPLNSVDIKIRRAESPHTVEVSLSTVAPGFEAFLIRENEDGGWTQSQDRFFWTFHQGHNRLEMRVRTKAGILGPISWAQVRG